MKQKKARSHTLASLIEQCDLMQVKLVLSIETKDVGKDVGKEFC